jgi:hypothetical protein
MTKCGVQPVVLMFQKAQRFAQTAGWSSQVDNPQGLHKHLKWLFNNQSHNPHL